MNAAQMQAEASAAILELAPAYGFNRVDPDLILAEAIHETGRFTSPLVVATNNAFGMKHPSRRETTSKGPTANGYATYSSIMDSVEDYLMRQRNFRIPNTSDASEYIAATVGSGYAEDPSYAAKWAAIYDPIAWDTDLAAVTIRPDQQASFPWLPVVLLAGAAFFASKRKKQ